MDHHLESEDDPSALRLPRPSEFRISESQYVHLIGWSTDWADKLTDSLSRVAVEPSETVYVLVCVSSALPEHQEIIIELLPLLDATSKRAVQFLPAGAITFNSQPTINERLVADCLEDLAKALSLRTIPPGALAIITCRTINDHYIFDIEGVFVLRSEKPAPSEFRELLFELAGRRAANKNALVTDMAQIMKRDLALSAIRQMTPWLTWLLDKLSKGLGG